MSSTPNSKPTQQVPACGRCHYISNSLHSVQSLSQTRNEHKSHDFASSQPWGRDASSNHLNRYLSRQALETESRPQAISPLHHRNPTMMKTYHLKTPTTTKTARSRVRPKF